MKIGVISDSHGETPPTRQALEHLDRHGVELTIHCGDVGVEIVPLLSGRTIHFVHGNMDNPSLLRDALVESEHTFHDRIGTLEVADKKIAFLHGHDVKLLHQTIHSGQWDLVCHGHTHTYSERRASETLVVNPGALARTDNPSMAVVELPAMKVTEISL